MSVLHRLQGRDMLAESVRKQSRSQPAGGAAGDADADLSAVTKNQPAVLMLMRERQNGEDKTEAEQETPCLLLYSERLV